MHLWGNGCCKGWQSLGKSAKIKPDGNINEISVFDCLIPKLFRLEPASRKEYW